jgi:hypothetical protein
MTQINKISHKKGAIIRDTNEIQRILREYFEKLYSNKLENLGGMDKFLETYNLQILNQEDISNLNRFLMSN